MCREECEDSKGLNGLGNCSPQWGLAIKSQCHCWDVKVCFHFSWGNGWMEPELGSVDFVGKNETNMNVY